MPDKDIYELVKENNTMLKKIYRAQQMHTYTRLIWIGLLVAVALGAYVWIKPYLSNIQNTYTGILESLDKTSQTRETIQDNFLNIIDLF